MMNFPKVEYNDKEYTKSSDCLRYTEIIIVKYVINDIILTLHQVSGASECFDL